MRVAHLAAGLLVGSAGAGCSLVLEEAPNEQPPGGAITIEPPEADMGLLYQGVPSAPFEVQLTAGSDGVELFPELDDPAFAVIEGSCGQGELEAGDACTVEVVFTPMVVGSDSADLVAGGQSMPLTGEAVRRTELVFNVDSHEFGFVQAAQSVVAPFTLVNGTALPVTITLVDVSTFAENFQISSNDCADPLLPAADCTVVVLFSPAPDQSYISSLVARTNNGEAAIVSMSGSSRPK